MPLQRLTDPTEEPLSLEDLKTQLRIDTDTEDDLILRLARAAREQVEQLTGRAMLTQSWQQSFDDWGEGSLFLDIAPARAVTEVSVLQEDGSEEIIPAADYLLNGQRVVFTGAMPKPSFPQNGIHVTFEAGQSDAADIPAALVQATALLTAHYYERREPYENERISAVPETVMALLSLYRQVRL
jgi:uncharacterized phiE125 gp8 family phage protein